jgi:hypothetical protein
VGGARSPALVMVVTRARLAPVLNVGSTGALHHLFRPRVRNGSILLKKSVADAVHATIESRRSAIRIKVASSTGLLNQSCAAAPSKSFFNTIGQNETCRGTATMSGPPQISDPRGGKC